MSLKAKASLLILSFPRGMELVARTLTEAGEPVPDAWVAEELAMNNRIGGRSNERGEYIIRGLRPGQRLRLTADQRELGLSGATEVEVEPGEVDSDSDGTAREGQGFRSSGG